jgi:c-di-GMP phosphodiesterase
MNQAAKVLDASSDLPAIDAVNACLGRQPIVDRGGQLVGYELLYRGADRSANDVAATSDVVVNLLEGVGFADSFGRFRASINVSADFLYSDMVDLLSPERVVFEILETVCATPGLIARINTLRARGFSFALDDVTEIGPGNAPFLEFVDYIKVDVLAVPVRLLGRLVHGLRRCGGKLLAEKVADTASFERCLALGFELFQGYHLARPQLLTGKRPDPNRQPAGRIRQWLRSERGRISRRGAAEGSPQGRPRPAMR